MSGAPVHVHPPLQPLEARSALVVERDDLAVEERVVTVERAGRAVAAPDSAASPRCRCGSRAAARRPARGRARGCRPTSAPTPSPARPAASGASVASIGRASIGGGTRPPDLRARRATVPAGARLRGRGRRRGPGPPSTRAVGVGRARSPLGEHGQQVRDVVAAVEPLLDAAREPVDAREHRHPPGPGRPVDVGELVDRCRPSPRRSGWASSLSSSRSTWTTSRSARSRRRRCGSSSRGSTRKCDGIDAALGREPDQAAGVLAGRGARGDDQHREVDRSHDRLELAHGRRRTHIARAPHVNPGAAPTPLCEDERMSDQGTRSGRETYTHGHHESVLRSHEWRTAENSAGYLLDRLEPGLDLLDVGCGPGTITIDLAAPGRAGIRARHRPRRRRHRPGRPAPEPRAERRVGACGSRPATCTRSSSSDASFDVVHAHQVLQHLRIRSPRSASCRRVLRPGGTLAVRDSDYAAFVWAPARSDARPVERAVPRDHRAQRRRGGRRPVPARLGAGRRVHRHRGRQLDVDVRGARSGGRGGGASGRTGSSSPRSPSRRSSTG